MKIKRRHREGAEVSTESMNDIMFFLLLFFLIVSTLANPNVLKLNLPSSENHGIVDTKPIIIEVDANRQYVIDHTPISFTQLEDALKIRVAALKTLGKEPNVILRFDSSLTIQDLADVMQIGYGLGVKMMLATKPSNG
ncbi:MAG: ExbD/TolR family protein [Bacteroidia bacterium]